MASPTTVSAQPSRPSRRSVNSTSSSGLDISFTRSSCSSLGCRGSREAWTGSCQCSEARHTDHHARAGIGPTSAPLFVPELRPVVFSAPAPALPMPYQHRHADFGPLLGQHCSVRIAEVVLAASQPECGAGKLQGFSDSEQGEVDVVLQEGKEGLTRRHIQSSIPRKASHCAPASGGRGCRRGGRREGKPSVESVLPGNTATPDRPPGSAALPQRCPAPT